MKASEGRYKLWSLLKLDGHRTDAIYHALNKMTNEEIYTALRARGYRYERWGWSL